MVFGPSTEISMEHNIEDVLQKYDNIIQSVCKRYAEKGGSLDWEDLAQECRIRIYMKWNGIKNLNAHNMKALIATICKNKCLNVIRDTSRQTPGNVVSIEQLRYNQDETS